MTLSGTLSRVAACAAAVSLCAIAPEVASAGPRASRDVVKPGTGHRAASARERAQMNKAAVKLTRRFGWFIARKDASYGYVCGYKNGSRWGEGVRRVGGRWRTRPDATSGEVQTYALFCGAYDSLKSTRPAGARSCGQLRTKWVFDDSDARVYVPVKAQGIDCSTARRKVTNAIYYSREDEAYWRATGWRTRRTSILDYPVRASKGARWIEYSLPTGGPFHEG